MAPEIFHSHQFVQDAVSFIMLGVHEALETRNECRIALSGGSTPKPVFEALAQQSLDWDRIVITFSDERCVPPTDEQSNFLMAQQALLNHVPIPARNILRMKGELDPIQGAREYEAVLRERSPHEIYRHDLLLLGMGEDGHTASLFPATHALKVTDRWVIENYVPKLNAWRITFTYPLINAARQVLFLVNSTGKDEVLRQVFHNKSDYPCSRVLPTAGRVRWLLGS